MHAILKTINSAAASLIVSWNFTQPVTPCPQIDPHLRFGSILGHDVTGLVKFQAPSSPLQPPEFDMILQIFLPHLRFSKFGGSCQILGVAEDYLANIAFTSSLQGTTYNKTQIFRFVCDALLFWTKKKPRNLGKNNVTGDSVYQGNYLQLYKSNLYKLC